MAGRAFTETPLRQVTRADGATKEIRVQDGHLFLCQGCCCGRTDKGFPALPLDEFKKQWKARGIRRRFHLTVSGCLGPCPLANVVLILFRGRSLWLHSINHPEDVTRIYEYVERMLRRDEFLEPPPELASRSFERYLPPLPKYRHALNYFYSLSRALWSRVCRHRPFSIPPKPEPGRHLDAGRL